MPNGVQMPMVGLGTWEAGCAEQLKTALRTAFDNGYRHIDTAYFYGNEDVIGEVIDEYIQAKKLARADIFVTTKISPWQVRPHLARQCIEDQLKALRVDYIDLLLIHVPVATMMDPTTNFQMFTPEGRWVFDEVPHIDTWRVMEEYYLRGKLRSIGISNFNERQIRQLFDQAQIKPHNHQIEVNIFCPNYALVNYSKRMGMVVSAYAIIGSPARKTSQLKDDWPDADLMGHPTVVRLAKKHKKTSAQILVRQMIQRKVVALVKSTNPERIKSNFDVFDFRLDADDMHELEAIKTRVRLFPFKIFLGHSEYPFADLEEEWLREQAQARRKSAMIEGGHLHLNGSVV
ncbi:oxidoreductase [Aphelenchoides avenae]|nr:oxidoreductase [Aphelenchus avenae]